MSQVKKSFLKFCGITNYEDAKDAIDLGVDALGFNFYAGSKRFISVGDAQTIVRRLPPSVWMVGVFVNHSRSQVEQIAREVGLDTLQFHGDEEASFSRNWGEWRTIRAVRLDSKANNREIASQHSESSDVLLFDSFSTSEYGGSGEEVGQEPLKEVLSFIPDALLAGGITPENAAAKVARYKPFGLDVASGIELSPGKKSYEKMKALVDAVSF